jgi:hypothetical protein
MSNSVRLTPKLIIGLGILALGLVWTLDNMGILQSERITDWWPVIVIGAGLARLADPRSSRLATVVIVLIGLLLLGDTLDYFEFDLGDAIPIFVLALGAKLVWDAFTGRRLPTGVYDPSAVINAVGIMAGIKRQSTALDFVGGSATAIMGGVEIDLREAKIPEGKVAVLDTFAFWGAVELWIPPDWKVDGQVFPLMGGFEDKTRRSTGTGPTLLIKGAAVMGAVEVKN